MDYDNGFHNLYGKSDKLLARDKTCDFVAKYYFSKTVAN